MDSDSNDYGLPVDDGDPQPARQHTTPAALRSELKRLARENAALRAQVARQETGAPEQPAAEPTAPPEPPVPSGEQDPAALRQQLDEANARITELQTQPRIDPATRRAMELTQRAQSQAIQQPPGLDGLYARAKDPSVPYETLVKEWEAYGLKPAPR